MLIILPVYTTKCVIKILNTQRMLDELASYYPSFQFSIDISHCPTACAKT